MSNEAKDIRELNRRVLRLEEEQTEVFGRDFRIGMFLLCLAFVCVAGHWIVAAVAWFAMKDAVFARS